VSAHWETERPRVCAVERPETIHDFYGFPDELYAMRYPAPGAPELARRAVDLLRVAGIAADTALDWGLDHGAWVPLKLARPEADIPVAQLSVQIADGPAAHLALGRALAPLREEGVLILGSGGAVHNLRALDRGPGARTSDWARAFEAWLVETVESGDGEALADYRRRAPHGAMAHPREEHILPLFVAAGAGAGPGRALHRDFALGSLALTAFAWD